MYPKRNNNLNFTCTRVCQKNKYGLLADMRNFDNFCRKISSRPMRCALSLSRRQRFIGMLRLSKGHKVYPPVWPAAVKCVAGIYGNARYDIDLTPKVSDSHSYPVYRNTIPDEFRSKQYKDYQSHSIVCHTAYCCVGDFVTVYCS